MVDTREQTPFSFVGLKTVRGTLPTGDYSLLGLESRVAVERKSHADAWGCIGSGRARFTRCLERLSQMESACIVIESSLHDFSIPPPHTERVDARMAVGSLISWSCQYRIPVWFCGSREYAEKVCLRWLTSFVKHRMGR